MRRIGLLILALSWAACTDGDDKSDGTDPDVVVDSDDTSGDDTDGPDTDGPDTDTDGGDTDDSDTDFTPDTDDDTGTADTDTAAGDTFQLPIDTDTGTFLPPIDTDSGFLPPTDTSPDFDTDGCLPNEIADCNGDCFPESLWGDGICHAGTTAFIPDFNCPDLSWDDGDCTPSGDTGASTPGCADPLDIEDCNGACYPQAWLGDGNCDDGTAHPWGSPDFECSNFGFDQGDCLTDTADTADTDATSDSADTDLQPDTGPDTDLFLDTGDSGSVDTQTSIDTFPLFDTLDTAGAGDDTFQPFETGMTILLP